MPRIALGLVLVLAACSSKPRNGTTNGGGHGTGTGSDDPVGAAPDAGGPTSLTRAQCDEIIDHVVEVMTEELRASKPEDQWPTQEQLADLRAGLAADFMDECQQYDRYVYDCLLAAKDSPSFAECAAEPAP